MTHSATPQIADCKSATRAADCKLATRAADCKLATRAADLPSAVRSNTGRFMVVVYQGNCYIANVVDTIAGTQQPNRVRIQRDVHLQGRVLDSAEYQFKTWADEEDY